MTTPLLRQYQSIKNEAKDCLLLYRMGDFYELFYDDAVIAARVLGLTLTSRNSQDENAAPLAGFPYHALEKYLPKLINAGHKVAVCEQTEDPAAAVGIVKREIIEVITRGTALSENCLDSKTNNYLAALCTSENIWGLSYLDLSTGGFYLCEGTEEQISAELSRLPTSEWLIPEEWSLPNFLQNFASQEKVLITPCDTQLFFPDRARHALQEHFKVHSLESFGCDNLTSALGSAATILHYCIHQKKTSLDHITSLSPRNLSAYMQLDSSTLRNLEILRPAYTEDEGGTLFSLLDRTGTSMGARLLKDWLTHPLLHIDLICARQKAIDELILRGETRAELQKHLRQILDMERIMSRIGSGRANARDVLGLGRSLHHALLMVEELQTLSAPLVQSCIAHIQATTLFVEKILNQICEQPPLTIREGGMMRTEAFPELHEILDGARQGKEWLNNLESTMREQTGISSLKVGFNRVFGYYLEVTKMHVEKVPENFIRKQTLVNAERYITPEMKEWESKILGAESQANKLEYEYFCALRLELASQSALFLKASHALAQIDVLCSLAHCAQEYTWVQPQLHSESGIEIVEGRHPVVEKLTPLGLYIPNNLSIHPEKRQILLMTGPNMAGKSTYLRQNALIVLLAQIGSFVPASKASIGLVDRIFTRVGASDRLAHGQSTFMVEMIETANILHNATPRSLVILDEIGRGTSTFDGLSLAWAIVEALHQDPAHTALTLFATHYHELTELPVQHKRVCNIQIAVEEQGQRVVFLHKVLDGACDSSYGIHVAAMAGIPSAVVNRAWEILAELEKGHLTPSALRTKSDKPSPSVLQYDLFSAPPPQNPKHKQVYDLMMSQDFSKLTPLDALNLLAKWQKEFSPGR